MKELKVTLGFLFVLLASTFANNTNWKIDKAHSKVQFTVSHMVVSDVTGQFNSFDANITSDGNDFSKGNIDFTIDVNSIDTDNEKRDAHLKSDDFFNAEKYPKILFKGKSLTKISDNKYKLKGHLTLRNITKPMEFDVVYGGSVKNANGKTVSGFKITGTINRFDYDLKWNKLLETGGAVVGKDVSILCNLELEETEQPQVSKE